MIQNNDSFLLELSAEMDRFEGYAHPHGLRVASIADAIGAKFDLAEQDRHLMQYAAMVHDIGEVAMDREYIGDTRFLSDIERIDMQRHPIIGEQEAAKHGLSKGVQLLIRWHHEWWNGQGYPDRLSHEQIPLAARIIRLADTFSAMTDTRPQRPAFALGDAIRNIKEWAGIEFDPNVVKAFLSLPESVIAVSERPTQERFSEADETSFRNL